MRVESATPVIFIPSLLNKTITWCGREFSGMPRKRWIAVVVVLKKETVSRKHEEIIICAVNCLYSTKTVILVGIIALVTNYIVHYLRQSDRVGPQHRGGKLFYT